MGHVVVFVQENHTTDNYFSSMRAWGANVATDGPTQPNPPAADQPHNRAAYAKWLAAQRDGRASPAAHSQFDTTRVLPFYAYLAATGVRGKLLFGVRHRLHPQPPADRRRPDPDTAQPAAKRPAAGLGPALDPRPRPRPPAELEGLHRQLWLSGRLLPPAQRVIQHRSDQLVADAASLARLSMVWHDSPYDEHPVADVTLGQDKVRQAVDAVVAAGHWADTVFLLTWDDWGGWDDHVATPNVEHTPDGVQLAYGPRVPLLMFGGAVRPGIDSRWSSHPSIGRTVLDLLGLPPLGVTRLDQAPSLADLIERHGLTPHHRHWAARSASRHRRSRLPPLPRLPLRRRAPRRRSRR